MLSDDSTLIFVSLDGESQEMSWDSKTKKLVPKTVDSKTKEYKRLMDVLSLYDRYEGDASNMKILKQMRDLIAEHILNFVVDKPSSPKLFGKMIKLQVDLLAHDIALTRDIEKEILRPFTLACHEAECGIIRSNNIKNTKLNRLNVLLNLCVNFPDPETQSLKVKLDRIMDDVLNERIDRDSDIEIRHIDDRLNHLVHHIQPSAPEMGTKEHIFRELHWMNEEAVRYRIFLEYVNWFERDPAIKENNEIRDIINNVKRDKKRIERKEEDDIPAALERLIVYKKRVSDIISSIDSKRKSTSTETPSE